MELGIKNRTAVITGGSRGIGKAAAIELAKEGCNIVLIARGSDKLYEAVLEIKSFGVDVISISADLSSKEYIESSFNKIIDRFKKIDILFNNAGVSANGKKPIEKTENDFEEHFNIHFKATYRFCNLVIPIMIKQQWGRIINMGSMAGISTLSGTSVYSAAKAAVINYTNSLALEYSKYGICANTICPGLIYTDIWSEVAQMLSENKNISKEEVLNLAADKLSAAKRFAKPAEVGKVVAFLASECASFISGDSIRVDGGALSGIEMNL
jgi:3-oxoacyl-[acyl-carrier protein] reductase